MPPTKSGIADYSAVLVDHLKQIAEVDVYTSKPALFEAKKYDALLYQIGNNPHHEFVYEMAMEYPGTVVMHESNLHHLIAGLTIKRNDWDTYVRECEHDGGAGALAFAERVRKLEIGPDYEGVPMMRRILQKSKAAIVHSKAVEGDLRKAGFTGPVARIPHGAWLPDSERMAYRDKLGLDEATPLIGVFGFLKPYKRIAESLRAFRRLVRLRDDVKMILVGEPHPEFPLAEIIRGLGLSRHVRMMGFTPPEDFAGYISAVDIVLNLRFPTVGESSGTLLRSLGLGQPVLVSNVGSFAEFPDSVCLKVPVDAREEDTIFEYLNLLVSQPQLGRNLGARAREWVAEECNWGLAARRYADFLTAVRDETPWQQPEEKLPEQLEEALAEIDPEIEPPKHPAKVEPEYILGWSNESRDYAETHITRLAKTLDITPRGGPDDRILEMGAYLQITPSLKTKLGYGEVRGCYYGEAGHTDPKTVESDSGEIFSCDVDLFDAEKDPFPYPDEHFATVLCGELIEHLPSDPMHMMSEVNRILKPGGHFVLTTPNIGSMRAIKAILEGYHPGFFPAYIRPSKPGEEVEARHNREYTPREIHRLLSDAGFDVTLLETGPFLDEPQPGHGWVKHLLERYQLSTDLRGDGIYAVGRKSGPIKARYPSWLYDGGE